jgi:ribosomal protein S18 acetylase RimI-like enzyme
MPDDGLPSPLRDGDIRIREALSSDIDDLVRLEERAFATDRLTRRRFAALAKSRSANLVVARVGPELAGYALVLTRRGSPAARLYSLAVSPDFAGRRLGARLLRAAECAARDRGADRMRLEVRSDNDKAIQLYCRHGYALTGRREAYYEDGMAALRFARRLDGAHGPRAAALGQAA